jgi:hypothetical protein
MYDEEFSEIFEEVPENDCRRMCPMLGGHGYPFTSHWCSYRNLECNFIGRQSSCSDYVS